jgi:hypothetical protein
MLFKSESIAEESKWDTHNLLAASNENITKRSSNGGFFFSMQNGKKKNHIEFKASIDIYD